MARTTLWFRHGWIAKYPLLFIRTLWLKFRYRNLPEAQYQIYQNAFYSSASPLVSNDTDKFLALRPTIAKAAFDDGRNRTVLEVGGGAGFQIPALSALGFSHITISDLSATRLAYAKRNYTDARLHIAVADAADLPFADHSFDALVSSAILHSMPNRIKRQAVAEFARVARNTIVIFEPLVLPKPGLQRWLFAKLAWLVDESQYIDDFICDPYDDDLQEMGFSLVDRQPGFMHATELKTYSRNHS